ncbi:conjugative transposon protein TraN [Zunongwangia profunda]|nr:conjugative transposon protein TraN [Zunongwangia profunda]
MPSKIYNSQSLRLVYVLPKFVLGSKEKLQLELQELNGSRKVLLKKRL